jgi:GNAT superfamily N-acetyltransferase
MSLPVFQLQSTHVDLLKRHFDELDADDVYLRFASALSREGRQRYVEGISFDRDAVFGVFADDLSLLGVAHLACLMDSAELGVSVLAPYRGHGIGNVLFKRAAVHARNLKIQQLFVNCLTQNAAMMHIARKNGMRVVVDHADAEAYLQLPPGNVATIGEEFAAQEVARLDWMVKAQLDCLRRLTFFKGRDRAPAT